MLQTAIDLSKQWPQTLAKVGFGSIFLIFAVPNLYWFSGFQVFLNFALNEKLVTPVGLVVAFIIFGMLYVAGSTIFFVGERFAYGKRRKTLVTLGVRVFETGNGILIQEFQETRSQAQLFGSIWIVFFFSGFVKISGNFLIGRPGDTTEGLMPFLTSIASGVSVSKVLGLIILLVLIAYAFKAIKDMTVNRFLEIEIETDRLLDKSLD